MEEKSLLDLSALPQNAFHNWKELWKPSTDSGGEYFEGVQTYKIVSLSINISKECKN
jgi:hypothetical protein